MTPTTDASTIADLPAEVLDLGESDEARTEGPTPILERGIEALRGLLRWFESEAPDLRMIMDRVDEDGAYSHAEETRKRVARHVLRFREVSDSVLDTVELHPADRFLGKRALTHLRLGWI